MFRIFEKIITSYDGSKIKYDILKRVMFDFVL